LFVQNKGGEDLRQDQRIEELWLLMNDLLRHNALTSSRGLQLETYLVVPMSMQLGLVEWVEVLLFVAFVVFCKMC
jgi:DNA-dependent protein kinase catalytic subunit